jgi:uncharacterized protein (TIGR02145 family)
MKKLLSFILLLSFNIKAQDVTIGTQTWMSKNLDVITYRNGDTIPEFQNETMWSRGELKSTYTKTGHPIPVLRIGAWCYYDNDAANGTIYGKLYNWYAVNDPRGLAPKGYHIPTKAEWKILTEYLGGAYEANIKMKIKNGTNTPGFSGLLGGYRQSYGPFTDIGQECRWWSLSMRATAGAFSDGKNDSLTPFSPDGRYSHADAFFRRLSNKIGPYEMGATKIESGLSVRCIKD